MAQQFHIEYIDDLDGTPLGESGETVEFSIDGRDYTIDLTEKNAAALREAFAPYVEHGTRASGGRKRASRRGNGKRSSGSDTKGIREWARENGHEVSDRGRIPQEIMDAYNAAN